mmetsp:Transcript_76343/g.150993  ORF Transcript_76343/g.150993 Transcript_76343/m.150993 type:complete len:293 (+) Transcript_76343:133-1011(+)
MRDPRGVRGIGHALRQWAWLPTAQPLGVATSPAEVARHLGVALLPGVLNVDMCSALRDFVLADLQASTRKSFLMPGIFQPRAKRGAAQTRWDLSLQVDDLVAKVLRHVLAGELGLTFKALCGEDAPLWELAVLVSAPGSVPQQLHTDTDFYVDPCLFTAFVALQDVTWNMGPTHFLPGTHTLAASEAFTSMETQEGLLRASHPVAGLLKAGDATLYDSRLVHGGGANAADDTRVLLTITFRHPGAPANVDNETCRSIHPTHRHERHLLSNFLRQRHELLLQPCALKSDSSSM